MKIVFRPMLAYDPKGDMSIFKRHLDREGSLLVSYKLDGIRAVVINRRLMSRSMKPIRNVYTQELFGRSAFEGIDGELIVGAAHGEGVMQRTTSGVMSSGGLPRVYFHVFDMVHPRTRYLDRLDNLMNVLAREVNPYVVLHKQYLVSTIDELLRYEEQAILRGFEGLIVRTPYGLYKQGRSTAEQGYLGKMKRFSDSEAKILSIQELQRNTNLPTIDGRGFQVRSSEKAGMVGGGMAGVLTVQDMYHLRWEFGVGSGLDDTLRSQIWANKEKYIGRIIKYKYLPYGTVDAPRHPVFLGFRDKDDL